MNDFGIIRMKFGNEFWLILFREYISPKIFAVWAGGPVRQPYAGVDFIPQSWIYEFGYCSR
jgi:hypothetical protein